jgi:hypothetical protein
MAATGLSALLCGDLMPRFAIVNGTLVENVALYVESPVIAGRVAVLLSTNQAVNPGDSYDGAVFTPRVPSVIEQRAAAATQRLISSRARLQQIRDQAQAASTGGAFANLAAASTAIRQIAGGIADLAQNILDLELVAAYQQDNGAE